MGANLSLHLLYYLSEYLALRSHSATQIFVEQMNESVSSQKSPIPKGKQVSGESQIFQLLYPRPSTSILSIVLGIW